MAFTICAELPLRTYAGAAPDGTLDRIPSVSRLFSALLAAAGFGPRAVWDGETLGPCDADAGALMWLEGHPPDQVSIPALHVNRGSGVAYRNDGTIYRKGTAARIKVRSAVAGSSVAVAGTFAWTWDEQPPAEVAAALQALCPDVSHLGTTETPVRLRVSTAVEPQPTHRLDPEAGLFDVGGLDVEVPLGGRLRELARAHGAAGVRPSAAKDKVGTDEKSSSPVPSREAVAVARYSPVDGVDSDVPWPTVVLLSLDRPVRETDRVAVAVAAHRALIRRVGAGAPALITGVYPAGVPRPANRLAIHVLPEGLPVQGWTGGCALALLVPAEASSSDVSVLMDAVPGLGVLRPQGLPPLRVSGDGDVVDGATLWQPATTGRRVWTTASPAVPETRGVPGSEDGFADAALLSVGHVWRDRLPPVTGCGAERHRSVVTAVKARGVVVRSTQPLRKSAVDRYVHTVNRNAVVRPYRLVLDLGDLCPDTAVVAIGQSRHLGGGLLVPAGARAEGAR